MISGSLEVLTPSAPELVIRITEPDQSKPIPAADVQLTHGTTRIVGTTDSNGRVAFDGLAAAQYQIRVRRIGYLPYSGTVDIGADSVRDVRLVMWWDYFQICATIVTS